MRTVLSDIRHALRVFIRTPSYAIAVAGVLALGIGANTAIFTIVNAVLLRPLPFAQPDRLVRLFHTPPQTTFPGMATFSLSPANFLDWQRDSTFVRRDGGLQLPPAHPHRHGERRSPARRPTSDRASSRSSAPSRPTDARSCPKSTHPIDRASS